MTTFFGTKIREERKKRDLTVQMIATSCGVSRSYITLIETGRRLPGKKILPKLAGVLQIKTATALNWYLQEISTKLQACMKE